MAGGGVWCVWRGATYVEPTLEFESVSLGGGARGSLVRLRDLILREMDSERVCAWPRGVAEAPAGGVPEVGV